MLRRNWPMTSRSRCCWRWTGCHRWNAPPSCFTTSLTCPSRRSRAMIGGPKPSRPAANWRTRARRAVPRRTPGADLQTPDSHARLLTAFHRSRRKRRSFAPSRIAARRRSRSDRRAVAAKTAALNPIHRPPTRLRVFLHRRGRAKNTGPRHSHGTDDDQRNRGRPCSIWTSSSITGPEHGNRRRPDRGNLCPLRNPDKLRRAPTSTSH